ncbi:MAG: hypothetical protein H6727_16665 [Myxococcales bacterium]|nr:hypothetical protein [Myxococcales bacterium]
MMFKVWSVYQNTEQEHGFLFLPYIRAFLLRRYGRFWGICSSLVLCGWFGVSLGGCVSVCSDCPAVTLKIEQKLEPCDSTKLREGTGISHSLVLQFKLSEVEGAPASSEQAYAWLLSESKKKSLPIKTERVLNNFYCSFDGTEGFDSCPCVTLDNSNATYKKAGSCDTSGTLQIVNGMNLVIAVSRRDVEGGFRFQLTTATKNEEDQLVVLDAAKAFASLAPDNGSFLASETKKIAWSSLKFGITGYWRQDDENSKTPERIGFFKSQESVTFRPEASEFALVKDESACPK